MASPELVELYTALNEQACRLARKEFSGFVRYVNEKYNMQWFHELIANHLQAFAEGRIKKLMIFTPPQHGKSELTSRLFPPYILGLRPTTKIVIASYNTTVASGFNRSCQRYIDSDAYRWVFPDTQLNSKNVRNVGTWLRNSDIFEVVGYGGFLKSVGRGGGITSTSVDIGIIDDPIKGREESLSPTIRQKLWEWYCDDFETRLHNDSQILLIQTRWHEDDLAGRLLLRDNDWTVIVLPAIKTENVNNYDPRKEGEALWPGKHSLERLLKIQADNPYWDSLYQQDPKPLKGLMYTTFKTYAAVPLVNNYHVKAYIDTADKGDDYLCCIVYAVTETGIYILDVYYTQEAMEITENEVAIMLTKYSVKHCDVESNNGGRGFARAVEKNLRLIGNVITHMEDFTQTANKAARIYTASSAVQNMIYYPDGWSTRFPAFFKSLTGYLKSGKNAHDDAEDSITGVWEMSADSFTQATTGVNYAQFMR